MKPQYADIETIHVPHRFVDLADRRTRGIVRAACHDANVLQSIARSCYLQGLEDGTRLLRAKRNSGQPEDGTT